MHCQRRSSYYIERGYCIKEDFPIREFRKVIKAPFNIVLVEFEYMTVKKNVRTRQSFLCKVLATKELNDSKSQLVYYSTGLYHLSRQKGNHLSTSLIRYHYISQREFKEHYCESLCVMDFESPSIPSISKSIELKEENLIAYLENLIFRAINNSTTLRHNVPFLEENLKRIRWNELYKPIHFTKVDFAKPLILKLSSEYPVILDKLKDEIVKKFIGIFEDYYVTSIYKGGLYSDCTKEILAKIRNSSNENELMIKTICDAISDIIIITELLYSEEKVIQSSLYIDQSDVEKSFKLQKCIFFILFEALMYEDLIENESVFIKLKNGNLVQTEAYFHDRTKFIVVLEDLNYSDLDKILVKIFIRGNQPKKYWITVN